MIIRQDNSIAHLFRSLGRTADNQWRNPPAANLHTPKFFEPFPVLQQALRTRSGPFYRYSDFEALMSSPYVN
jgi:hypothetical protein